MDPKLPEHISTGHVLPEPNWHTAKHAHPFYELIVMVNGGLHVELGGERLEAAAQDALLYPPHVPHTETTSADHPHEAYFLGFFWEPEGAKPPTHVTDATGRIQQLITWMHAARVSGALYSDHFFHAFAEVILGEYLRAAHHGEHQLVVRTRTFMRNHLEQGLSLGDLAANAGMSKFHFAREYKRCCGITPMQDLRRLRIERARNLLAATNLPLKAIAPKTGFCDEYHLSRSFLREFHMNPSEFRKRSR